MVVETAPYSSLFMDDTKKPSFTVKSGSYRMRCDPSQQLDLTLIEMNVFHGYVDHIRLAVPVKMTRI